MSKEQTATTDNRLLDPVRTDRLDDDDDSCITLRHCVTIRSAKTKRINIDNL